MFRLLKPHKTHVQEYQEKEPELAAQFKRAVMDRKLPDNWTDALPKALCPIKPIFTP